MMSELNEIREYVVRTLRSQGLFCPEHYATMLAETPLNKVIENLSPWAFLPDPERSSKYCSEALGRAVWPFAQAVEQDLIACFVPTQSGSPTVVVINPWSEDKRAVLKKEFADYDAWLIYAAEISRQVQASEADEDADD